MGKKQDGTRGKKFLLNDSRNQSRRASAFLQEVGALIFGDIWKTKDIAATIPADDKNTSPLLIGKSHNPIHRKLFVQARILEALAADEIVAQIILPAIDWPNICATAWSGNISFKQYFADTLPSEIGSINAGAGAKSIIESQPKKTRLTSFAKAMGYDEDELPISEAELVEFLQCNIQRFLDAISNLQKFSMRPTIKAEFWDKLLEKETASKVGRVLDWNNSLMLVDSIFIHLDPATIEEEDGQNKWGHLEKLAFKGLPAYLDDSKRTYVFLIENHQQALKLVTQKPIYIEEKGWATEVMKSKEYFWPLLVAAIWRVLAFKLNNGEITPGKQNPPHDVKEEVLNALKDYLNSQFPESADTKDGKEFIKNQALRPVISKICNQFWHKDEPADIMVGLTKGMTPKIEKSVKKSIKKAQIPLSK